MNPLKSRQLGLARHLDDQLTPLAGAKDSVWRGSGRPGWTQPLPREDRLFKGGALPQTWPQRRTPDSRMPAGPSLCTRSSQKGWPVAGADRARFLQRNPWRAERLPTPVLWPGEFHGLYSPRGHKESDRLSDFHFTSLTSWCHTVFQDYLVCFDPSLISSIPPKILTFLWENGIY